MQSLEFQDDRLRLIDQTRLPHEVAYLDCRTAAEVAEAIASMRVRGAPAIGVAAAYGMALGAREAAQVLGGQADPERLAAALRTVAERLRRTRPTAVNLFWALERCLEVVGRASALGPAGVAEELRRLADQMAEADVRANQQMGQHGAALLPPRTNVLTHCNTGALATVGYGTALGVIRAAVEAGKRVHVFVDETRPFLQGARLTAWELQRLGIPMTLITDSMAGYFMARGQVDLVLVGADRIARNGDVANKIGTYTLAVLCRAHQLPCYVVAPTSTVDFELASGADIPIEQRNPEEVTHLNGQRIAPAGVQAAHPAFDVTPARLVSAIVTEAGVCRPPFELSLRQAVAIRQTETLPAEALP
ncbi:MAG: S-methyl-5-thioribose-1-phosphate isomerase [Chloroflexi bacterium]|nr:S-methyl-5-thioribose-1-phosphate isomerase [Chloroflexota bacterium]